MILALVGILTSDQVTQAIKLHHKNNLGDDHAADVDATKASEDKKKASDAVDKANEQIAAEEKSKEGKTKGDLK